MKIYVIAALLAAGMLQGVVAAAPLPVSATALLTEEPKQDSPLTLILTVQKIISVEGREQRIDTVAAGPGDVLEYRAEYKNVGTAPLMKVMAILPVPEHTSFIDGSAHPAEIAVSARNARDTFMSPPLMRPVSPSGEMAVAPADAYGALRWAIDKLLPGQAAVVSMRVRVDQLAPQTLLPSAPAGAAGSPNSIR